MTEHLRDSAPDARLTLSEAAALIDSLTLVRPPASTVYRWVDKGVRGRRLASVWVGGRVYTTRSAVEEFLRNDPAFRSLVRTPEAPRPAPVMVSGLHDRMERGRSIEAARAHLKQRVFRLVLCC